MHLRPKQSDIEITLEYLNNRLTAERGMFAKVKELMQNAARLIVGICYKYCLRVSTLRYDTLPIKARWEIDKIISKLVDDIEEYYQYYCTACADDEEERKTLLAIALGEYKGVEFSSRLSEYADNYTAELLTLINAGFALDLAEDVISQSIVDNLQLPYQNKLLIEELQDNIISYGRGRTNSMLTAITALAVFGVSRTWSSNFISSSKRAGAIAWSVRRGSSYPCELCDSNVGIHLSDDNLPPYHLRCCCYAVPIYPQLI